MEAETLAELLGDSYTLLDVPGQMVSNRRMQFISGCMMEVCRLLGIKQKTAVANDYRIDLNEKEKTFHANQLKRYITNDAVSDEIPTDDSPVSAASLSVVKDDDEGSGYNEYGLKSYQSFVTGIAQRH
ncbi:hypothetical protein PoB_001304200 [Plakobranchus ocellatus]|uniref:Uncharacterized protein n=1 Tax=Plakobranchus ocellatus TaxID=259542 RepID=A0AAV3YUB5_9GAST|nr:hypothetical protein PoB_001304200 [Plakobranchus ocellatus]